MVFGPIAAICGLWAVAQRRAARNDTNATNATDATDAGSRR